MKKFNWQMILCLFVFLTLHSCNRNPAVKLLSGGNFEMGDEIHVFIFVSTECPLCQKYQGGFYDRMKKGTKIYFVFPGLQSSEQIREFTGYDSIPPSSVILDPEKKICKYLKALVTPQAVITYNKQIKYSGLIDDRFGELGAKEQAVQFNYLENALNSLLKNEAVQVPYTKAIGCFIEPD